jgi:hypothetical protein
MLLHPKTGNRLLCAIGSKPPFEFKIFYSSIFLGDLVPTSDSSRRTRDIYKITFAITAAPLSKIPNPKIAEANAMMKEVIVNCSII